MTQPTPAFHFVKKAYRKEVVESKLRQLRESNRLCIHMNEYVTRHRYAFCNETWDSFVDDPKDIAKKLPPEHADIEVSTLPLLSMSFLPPAEKSIKPYFAVEGYASTYGYLVDLSQEGEDTPRVMGAMERGIVSGVSAHHKSYWSLIQSGHCAEIYDPFDFHTWLHTLAGPEGAALTARQLDTLADYYKNPACPDVSAFNEIIVAAAKKHIAAITIPIYDGAYNAPDQSYANQSRLAGALVGLDHLNRGITLPVVLYHINGSQHAQCGSCTFLGETREELIDIALDSIRRLQSGECTWHVPHPSPVLGIKDQIRNVLNLEIDVPLEKQADKMLALRKSCKAAAGAHSGMDGP